MADSPMLFLGRRGRAPRAGVRADKRIEFRVTDAERAAIAQVAKDNGYPVATLVREAVNSLVGDYSDAVPIRNVR